MNLEVELTQKNIDSLESMLYKEKTIGLIWGFRKNGVLNQVFEAYKKQKKKELEE